MHTLHTLYTLRHRGVCGCFSYEIACCTPCTPCTPCFQDFFLLREKLLIVVVGAWRFPRALRAYIARESL